MYLMSNCMVLSKILVFDHVRHNRDFATFYASKSFIGFACRRSRLPVWVPNAKNRKSKKRAWWERLFFNEDNWFGLKEDDMLEEPKESGNDTEDGGEKLSEEDKFEAWKRRAEAIIELREAQEDMKNSENREWEDWIGGEGFHGINNPSSAGNEWEEKDEGYEREASTDPAEIVPKRGVVDSARDLVIGDEDDLLYEDRVFRYASWNSAKFLALLILIPWAMDFIVHDYVLMPFLDRYVKTVPLAAEILDVRKSQKLEMIKTLKIEKARFRFEVEIGKTPPLSDEEVWWELRHKALELRDDWRLENRKVFANIWSDMVFGIVLFILIYFNQSKVALLKFTGYKILNNISDTGKAFLIILVTDIFLGYHSESGWQTLIEIILEHYGLEVDQSAITIFVCFIPVVTDACVKLWLFKFLPRLSPNVSNIFREMQRH